MVGAYLAGRAAINVVSDQVGARLLVVDAGVAAELPPHPGLVGFTLNGHRRAGRRSGPNHDDAIPATEAM